MEIKITEDAFKWFQYEMEVIEGEYIRFFVRFGGSGLQPGFSLGVTKDQPYEKDALVEKDGVIYFIEESDLWYFDGHDLTVSVNAELDELNYSYE